MVGKAVRGVALISRVVSRGLEIFRRKVGTGKKIWEFCRGGCSPPALCIGGGGGVLDSYSVWLP